jgi:hypothetical protein
MRKAESLKENSPGQAMRKQAPPWVINPKANQAL